MQKKNRTNQKKNATKLEPFPFFLTTEKDELTNEYLLNSI